MTVTSSSSPADNIDETVIGADDAVTSQTLISTDELTDADVTATADAAADGDHGDDDVVARNLQKRQSVLHNT